MVVRLRSLVGCAITACLAGSLACSAPTLPLPPPDTEVGPPNELGIVEVQGSGAEPESIVVCENTNAASQDSVGIDRADGAGEFVVSLEAQPADVIACYYFVGYDRSEPSESEVPPPP
jgi:hypothetical protein